MKLNLFENGRVQFIPGNEGRKETTQTSEKEGITVNIVNAAIAPTPAHFITTFFITWSREEHGNETANRMSIDIPVYDADKQTPYLQIENAAAHRVPEELRALADLIQADLDRADAARVEDQSSE